MSGGAAAAAMLLSGVGAASVLLALFFLASLTGSAFYGGMSRATAATSVTVNGERVLAQGAGRGGQGFLGAHVVVVTDSSIASVSVRPWGAGPVADSIWLAQICSVEAVFDYLRVAGLRKTITLEHCLASEVTALLDLLPRGPRSVA